MFIEFKIMLSYNRGTYHPPRQGPPTKEIHMEITKADRDEVLRMSEAGHQSQSISDELGLSRSEVMRVLKDAGIVPIGHGRDLLDSFSEDRLVQLKVDYEELRMPVRALLSKYNLRDASVLYSLLEKIGVKPRTWPNSPGNRRKQLLETAVKMYLDRPDMTIAKICEETGVLQPTLNAELRRQHAPARRPSMLKENQAGFE